MLGILWDNAYSVFWLLVIALALVTTGSADLQSRLEAQLRTHLGAILSEFGAAVPRIDLRLIRAEPLYKSRRLVLLRSGARNHSARIWLVFRNAEDANRAQTLSNQIVRELQSRLAATSTGLSGAVALELRCVAGAEVQELRKLHPEMFGPTPLEWASGRRQRAARPNDGW